jgi:hypothetical protein
MIAMARTVLGLAGVLLGIPAFGQNEPYGPYIGRYEPRDVRMSARINVLPYVSESGNCAPSASLNVAQTTELRASPRYTVEQGTVYWPLAGVGASYEVDRSTLDGTLTIDGSEVPIRRSLYDRDSSGKPMHSGGSYAQWGFGPLAETALNASMEISFEARLWNTTFDEAGASAVPWPTKDWPAEAAGALGPMLFVDAGFDGPYTQSKVAELVDRMTEGKHRSQPPVIAAKWVAGELARRFQPSGPMTVADMRAASAVGGGQSIGAVGAIETLGAGEASARLKGAPVDLPLLLVACYRQMGIPARLVLGYSVGDEEMGLDRDRRNNDRAERGLYAWVEFALYDESQPSLTDALSWVPVDILYMRANNVGRRPFDTPWNGFGQSEQHNWLVPLAYHLHPHDLPAIAYGASVRREPRPALWGWNLAPVTPMAAEQILTFFATSPSMTIQDMERQSGGR